MIVKTYIKNHLFHLPRKQEDLTAQIKEKFFKRKKLVKSGINKMYPVTKIEKENNKLESSRDLNIFLLNIYLLFIESKGLDQLSNIEIELTNENIKKELSKEISQIEKQSEIEDIEKHVENYIKNSFQKNKETKQNIFNMKWIIEMDRKLRSD